MTLYQGGKKRIGKRIHDVLLKVDEDATILRSSATYRATRSVKAYFEPFVGMGSVLKYFGEDGNRDLFASDKNIDLIIMWKAIQNGWLPPLKVSKSEYEELKLSKKHSADRAFIGTVASWGGIWFHAYRLHLQKNGKDFMREGYNGIINTKQYMDKVTFLQPDDYENSYFELVNKMKSKGIDTEVGFGLLIYCDPPYKGNNLNNYLFTTFDHNKFWNNMREWSKNNIVIISESDKALAPTDFKKIWSTQSSSSNKYTNKKYIDCLYVHESIYSNISQKTKREIKKI